MRENKRNSRDDKSKGEDKRKSSEKSFGASASRKTDGARKPSFKDRPQSGFGDKEAGNSRPSRSAYGNKEGSNSKSSRPSFGDREGNNSKSSRPGFGDREGNNSRPSRPSFGDREGNNSRPSRPGFGDREGSNSRPSRPGFGDRKTNPSREGKSFNPRFKSEDSEGTHRDSKAGEGRFNKFKANAESKSRGFVKGDVSKTKGERTGPGSKDVRPFRKRAESDSYRTKNTDFRERKVNATSSSKPLDDKVRLNRYIANAGICSRRKADELIEAGVISVNNVVISELGFKVDPAKDTVKYNGELLKREKKVYVLLNKPKDYITTTEDPQERRTVMHLVEKASRERIYPVGRLDRNTTGLLLMTNDGDLADKLSHPKNGITKIYQVELSRNLSQGDLNKIQFGLELEDGIIKPDSVSYVTGGSKKEIGIQIHSGKNRIVRRIFEHLGYEVVKLDRVVYGNLTKKDLPRGRWRYLDEHELIQIKHLIQ